MKLSMHWLIRGKRFIRFEEKPEYQSNINNGLEPILDTEIRQEIWKAMDKVDDNSVCVKSCQQVIYFFIDYDS